MTGLTRLSNDQRFVLSLFFHYLSIVLHFQGTMHTFIKCFFNCFGVKFYFLVFQNFWALSCSVGGECNCVIASHNSTSYLCSCMYYLICSMYMLYKCIYNVLWAFMLIE